MAFNPDVIRADTPGVEHVTHLITCGAALMPQPVVNAVIE